MRPITLLLILAALTACGDDSDDPIPASTEPCEDDATDCVDDVDDGGTYDATCIDGSWTFDIDADGNRQRCFYH